MRTWGKFAVFLRICERYKEWAGREKQEQKAKYAKNRNEKTILRN
jgi:hypothetical protein